MNYKILRTSEWNYSIIWNDWKNFSKNISQLIFILWWEEKVQAFLDWYTWSNPYWFLQSIAEQLSNENQLELLEDFEESKELTLSYLWFSEKITLNEELNEEERKVQLKFARQMIENIEYYILTYEKQFWNLLNTDEAREFCEEYSESHEWRSKFSNATHEVASSFIKLLFQIKLDRHKWGKILFMAWWTWAWKTSWLMALWVENTLEEYDIVYDTNMNKKSSTAKKILQCASYEIDLTILYVYRDPEEAFRNWMLPRAEKKWRSVPIKEHVNTHIWSFEVIEELLENDSIEILIVDNSFWKSNQKESTIEEIKEKIESKLDSNYLKTKLEWILEEEFKNETISPRVYFWVKS